MDLARINTLLEPFLESALHPTQSHVISIYIDLLLRWNARTNLTAIRDPEEIAARHFGESLFLARHLFPDVAQSAAHAAPKHAGDGAGSGLARMVLDIGSGAGFPGLPIKIWDSAIHLTLVESNHKKATFLREVVRALALTNVNVIVARAESLIGTHPPSHVVTLRAVEHFEAILPT